MAGSYRLNTGESLKGAKELDAQLKALAVGMAPKVLRGAMRDAMKPVLVLYKARMRVGTRSHTLTKTYGSRLVGPGFSKRNTYLSTTVARDGSSVAAHIGPKPPAFYNLWFNEIAGFRGGPGKRAKRAGRRRISPDARLVPVFRAQRSTMLSSFVASGKKRIAAIAAKKGAR